MKALFPVFALLVFLVGSSSAFYGGSDNYIYPSDFTSETVNQIGWCEDAITAYYCTVEIGDDFPIYCVSSTSSSHSLYKISGLESDLDLDYTSSSHSSDSTLIGLAVSSNRVYEYTLSQIKSYQNYYPFSYANTYTPDTDYDIQDCVGYGSYLYCLLYNSSNDEFLFAKFTESLVLSDSDTLDASGFRLGYGLYYQDVGHLFYSDGYLLFLADYSASGYAAYLVDMSPMDVLPGYALVGPGDEALESVIASGNDASDFFAIFPSVVSEVKNGVYQGSVSSHYQYFLTMGDTTEYYTWKDGTENYVYSWDSLSSSSLGYNSASLPSISYGGYSMAYPIFDNAVVIGDQLVDKSDGATLDTFNCYLPSVCVSQPTDYYVCYSRDEHKLFVEHIYELTTTTTTSTTTTTTTTTSTSSTTTSSTTSTTLAYNWTIGEFQPSDNENATASERWLEYMTHAGVDALLTVSGFDSLDQILAETAYNAIAGYNFSMEASDVDGDEVATVSLGYSSEKETIKEQILTFGAVLCLVLVLVLFAVFSKFDPEGGGVIKWLTTKNCFF